MKKPKDPDSYISRRAAAAALRGIADEIERGSPDERVKWFLNTWFWNPKETQSGVRERSEG